MGTGLKTRDDHEALWQLIQQRRAKRELERLAPPLIQLYDGDYTLRGVVGEWRSIDYEFIENDTGTASIQLSLDNYLAKWVMDFRGRAKRNVHITIDKQGSRWSGFMDNYKVVKKDGDQYLEVTFKHDYEQAKHIVCWANPFLRPEVQFPKLWVIFGPAKWCLLMTLFVNILRLESSLWTLPDNPLDINEWMPLSFNPSNWRNIVKPFPLLGDNSNITIVFSRFKMWHDVAKKILADAQLTVTCRRYLPSQGDTHPFASLLGELDNVTIEDLATAIPLREGCLVWDIVDNSGWGTGTAFGGSLLTGLVRAAINISDDGYYQGIDVFDGDPTFPGEYYDPGFTGTMPEAPWVVYVEGPYTGIKSSEFQYFEATDTSFLTGGHSMPGVNEAISAAINMGGDFLTSLINTWIGMAPKPTVAWGGGVTADFSIDIPPLGGVIDAVAKIFYEDVFLAFEEVPTTRAVGGEVLPLAGLESLLSGLGDFHMFEGWADGADKAFTLAAQMAIRAKIWATRARTTHTLKISDAAPYRIGETGYGDYWLGNRIGTNVLGFPDPFVIFVERVSKIRYGWDKNGSKGWEIDVGYREPQDPAFKALDQIREINGALSTFGIL